MIILECLDCSPWSPWAVLVLVVSAAAVQIVAWAISRAAALRQDAAPSAARILLAVALALILLGVFLAFFFPNRSQALAAVPVTVIGIALAVLGGSPVVRQVLGWANGGQVPDGEHGGITVAADDGADAATAAGATREIMRGGTTIGYLERAAVVLAVIAGRWEVLAVIVAVKGLGRFGELDASVARERFIIGTLSSLGWAALIALLIRLVLG